MIDMMTHNNPFTSFKVYREQTEAAKDFVFQYKNIHRLKKIYVPRY